jgi:hypothetical protein
MSRKLSWMALELLHSEMHGPKKSTKFGSHFSCFSFLRRNSILGASLEFWLSMAAFQSIDSNSTVRMLYSSSGPWDLTRLSNIWVADFRLFFPDRFSRKLRRKTFMELLLIYKAGSAPIT